MAQDKETLEIERLALEIRKLRVDLERAATPGLRGWAEQLSPFIVTLVALGGFLFGVKQYVDQQSESREAAVQQERREIEARDREAMKDLWQKELDLYFRASTAAATIATTRNSQEREAAVADFWLLYEGPLIVVESQEVSGAMKRFGACLRGEDECDERELRSRSRALASTIQTTVQESAIRRLSEFSKNKFQYHR